MTSANRLNLRPRPDLSNPADRGSRTSRTPNCPDRSSGNARCRKASRDHQVSLLFRKWDTSCDLKQLFITLHGRVDQFASELVVVRFDDAHGAKFAGAQWALTGIGDVADAVDV